MMSMYPRVCDLGSWDKANLMTARAVRNGWNLHEIYREESSNCVRFYNGVVSRCTTNSIHWDESIKVEKSEAILISGMSPAEYDSKMSPEPVPTPRGLPRFSTVEEVAEMLRVSEQKVLDFVDQYKVPHIRLPNDEVRFLGTDIWDWIRNYCYGKDLT